MFTNPPSAECFIPEQFRPYLARPMSDSAEDRRAFAMAVVLAFRAEQIGPEPKIQTPPSGEPGAPIYRYQSDPVWAEAWARWRGRSDALERTVRHLQGERVEWILTPEQPGDLLYPAPFGDVMLREHRALLRTLDEDLGHAIAFAAGDVSRVPASWSPLDFLRAAFVAEALPVPELVA